VWPFYQRARCPGMMCTYPLARRIQSMSARYEELPCAAASQQEICALTESGADTQIRLLFAESGSKNTTNHSRTIKRENSPHCFPVTPAAARRESAGPGGGSETATRKEAGSCPVRGWQGRAGQGSSYCI
jgi:hypothetical protein